MNPFHFLKKHQNRCTLLSVDRRIRSRTDIVNVDDEILYNIAVQTVMEVNCSLFNFRVPPPDWAHNMA